MSAMDDLRAKLASDQARLDKHGDKGFLMNAKGAGGIELDKALAAVLEEQAKEIESLKQRVQKLEAGR